MGYLGGLIMLWVFFAIFVGPIIGGVAAVALGALFLVCGLTAGDGKAAKEKRERPQS